MFIYRLHIVLPFSPSLARAVTPKAVHSIYYLNISCIQAYFHVSNMIPKYKIFRTQYHFLGKKA